MTQQRTLETTELFRALGPERLARLRPSARLRAFERGEYLYFEGQPAEALWVVRRGSVRTLKSAASGRVTTLEVAHPGEIFGLASLTEGAEYAETSQALEDGEAWRAPRRLLLPLIREDPVITTELLKIITRRLQNAQDRLCSFVHEGVPARLARVLLEQAENGVLRTTRRALGESAGTTVETTIRVLRSFEKQGWIRGDVGQIHVLERDALERVAHGESPES